MVQARLEVRGLEVEAVAQPGLNQRTVAEHVRLVSDWD